MGQQIVKQPNGKYAIFSSVVDAVIAMDCTREDLLEFWLDEERERLQRSIARYCDKLDAGEKPYAQFTVTWDEALAETKAHGYELPTS